MNHHQSKCPPFLQEHQFERYFPIRKEKLDQIWQSLNLRESFVKGQLFPYRVEFDAPTQEGPFQSGELNIHHGPLLSAHGQIGEVTPNYRDLQYFYGSYVLSFRWIRPLWNTGNEIFWKFLGITFLF
jgi:hypothetical protein